MQPHQKSVFPLFPGTDCVARFRDAGQKHLWTALSILAKQGGKALSTEEVGLFTLTFPKSLRFASGN